MSCSCNMKLRLSYSNSIRFSCHAGVSRQARLCRGEALSTGWQNGLGTHRRILNRDFDSMSVQSKDVLSILELDFLFLSKPHQGDRATVLPATNHTAHRMPDRRMWCRGVGFCTSA